MLMSTFRYKQAIAQPLGVGATTDEFISLSQRGGQTRP